MRRKETIADAVKLRDIAELTGVSPSTVSRALNHPDKVATATLQRILEVVRDQHYEPNVVARGLRRRQSTMIGLVIADILNDFYATVAKGVQDAAMRRGFTVVLANTDEDSAREEQFLRESYQHQFAGLVIVPTSSSERLLARFSRTPVVEVDRASGRAGAHVVLADNARSTVAAISHLARLGHERIATVSGNQSVSTGVERLQGFRDGMRQAGLPIDERWIVFAHRHDEASGFAAMESLRELPAEARPTAVFAFNNLITAGVLRSLRSAGIRVPDQVSLVGFDDSRWAQLMTPSLTVIAQPAREMGVLAAERLFSLIEHPGLPGTITRLATTLVLRESTAPPPARGAR